MIRQFIDPEGLEAAHMRSRRARIALVLVCLALVLTAGGLLLDPLHPPHTLHVWGHDYDRETGTVVDAPPADATATVIVQAPPGPLAWFGLVNAGPKPSAPTWVVYLQVGPAAFIPYDWRPCCEPNW